MSTNRKSLLLLLIVVFLIALVGGAYFAGRRSVAVPADNHHTATTTTAATSTTDTPTTSTTTVASQPTTTTGRPTVSRSVLAACSSIGGTPVEGQDNWYILGPTYLNPECKNVPYIGPDGETYYDDFPLTQAGISTTDVYGNSTHSALGGLAATESECATGQYPEANPGVDSPGAWDSSLGLCLP
ncbi:MAG: hypothetical protein WA860_03880 [Acidimicrobiales bacterium]